MEERGLYLELVIHQEERDPLGRDGIPVAGREP